MVAIVNANITNNRNGFICGGTLVHPQYVLTAAHCMRLFGFDSFHERPLLEPGDIEVVVGAWDLNDNLPRQAVDEIIIRPDFFEPVDTSLQHDLALIKLKTPVASPGIALAESTESSEPGTLATTLGWGRTDPAVSSAVTLLREVTVPTVSLSEAQTDLAAFYTLVEGQLGAGFPEGGRDACSGDSGGPLFVEVDGHLELIGITSFGAGCAEPNRPGMYADVFHYRRWIMDQMCPEISDWETRYLLTGWHRDDDGDGQSNLIEYANGTSPRNAAEVVRSRTRWVLDGGTPFLGLQARAWDAPGISYRVGFSEGGSFDADDWAVFDRGPLVVSREAVGPTFETIVFRSPVPATENPMQFLRLDITPAPTSASVIQAPGLLSAAIETSDPSNAQARREDLYRFEVNNTQNVQIDMASIDFDSYLVVYDEDGMIVFSDDNSGIGMNAAVIFAPQGNTPYVIGAAANGTSTGSYELRVTPF